MKVEINELFLLKDLFNGAQSHAINMAYQKKNFKSVKDKFKPKSSQWFAEEVKEQINEKSEVVELIDKYEKLVIYARYDDEISFHIVRYKDYDLIYDRDDESYEDVCIERFFLVENSHWGFGPITSFNQLLNNDKIIHMLVKQQESSFKENIMKRLLHLSDEFSILHEVVYNAHKEFKQVMYYTSYFDKRRVNYGKCVVIDEDIYSFEDIKIIYDSYKNGDKFYDKNDTLIEKEYGEDYYHFFMRCNINMLV